MKQRAVAAEGTSYDPCVVAIRQAMEAQVDVAALRVRIGPARVAYDSSRSPARVTDALHLAGSRAR